MAAVLKTVIGASLSRVQIPTPPPRIAGWFCLLALPAAAVTVTVAGLVTPDYDAMTRTVSRLAEPGRPAAFEVDIALSLVAAALLLLGLISRQRGVLLLAGGALLVVASVHLDPKSASATAVHRLASGTAMLALTFATVGYWRGLGLAMIGLLGVALLLAPTGFSAWGLWERAFLVLAMASVMLMSRVSVEETMSAPAAIDSSRGS